MTLQAPTGSASPPPPTGVALELWQGWWNGLTFGEGTTYPLIDNLEQLTALETRLSDQPIPQQDGDIPYGRWAAGRFVTLPFLIHGQPQTDQLYDDIATWTRAFEAADPYRHDWLLFRIPGRTLMARARVARRSVEMSPPAAREGRHAGVVELKLADPRLYDFEEGTQTVTIPTGIASGGGIDLGPLPALPTGTPSDLPWDMDTAAGGSVNAYNSGNSEAYPLIRCSNAAAATGPITYLEVRNTTTGVTFEITTDIQPGQTLEADFDGMVRAEQGPHIRIDDASRYADWHHPRVPLYFAPGNNTLLADIAGVGSIATVRADWLNPTL